jgi:hypothetical protein
MSPGSDRRDGKSADRDNGIRDVMMGIDDPEQEEYFVERLRDASFPTGVLEPTYVPADR